MLDYISLVLGAGIGLLCSIGLFLVQEQWKRRNEKNNVIALLRTEISLILQVIEEGIIPSVNESLRLVETPAICIDMPIAICVDIPIPKLDTQFYEKSINSIALIKTEKLSQIKNFYFAVNLYQHAIEKAFLYKSDKVMLKSWLEKALSTIEEVKRFGKELLLEF